MNDCVPASVQSVGPSGLPAGTLSIYGGSGAAEHAGATSPGKLGEGATPDAAAAAVGRGFHLGDMPPCDDKGTTSKTALWSGKVRGPSQSSQVRP